MTITKWRAIPTVPPIEPGTYNMLDALSENLRKAQSAINTIQSTSYSGLISVGAGPGLTAVTTNGVAVISPGTELAGLAGLSTTGFVQRTGTGQYITVPVPGGGAPGRAQAGVPTDVQPFGYLHENLTTGDLYASHPVPVPAIPTVVNFSTAGTAFVATPTNHYELTMPFTPTAGNLVIIGTFNNTYTTAPTGWTVVHQGAGAFTNSTWYAKIWRSSDPLTNIVWPDGSSVLLNVWEVKGAGNGTVVSAFDGGSTTGATTGTPFSGFSGFYTAVANELSLGIATTQSTSDPPVTLDVSWTQDSIGTGQNTAAHKLINALGAQVTMTQNSQGFLTNRSLSAITLKPGITTSNYAGWNFIGPVKSYNNGTFVDSQLKTLSFTGSGVTAGSDGAGNVVVGISQSSSSVATSYKGTLLESQTKSINYATGVTASTDGLGNITINSTTLYGTGAPSSSVTPSVDGTPTTNTVTGSASPTITFTSAATRVAVLYLGIEQNPAVVVNTVTSPHLTWTRRAQAGPTQGDRAKDEIEVWWAPVSTAVTSEVVTVTCSATPDNVSLAVVVVQNVGDITNPWDPNASLPSISTNVGPGGSATPAPVFSTTNGYALAIAASYNDVARTETSVWSSLFAANTGAGSNWSYLTGWNNSYSTAQTSVTASLTSGDTGIHVRLVDVLTGYRGASPTEGSIYYDTGTTPYTGYTYHTGTWHQVGSSSGGGVTFQSAGSTLGTATTINITGAGAAASFASGVGTINVTGGGSSGSAPPTLISKHTFGAGETTFTFASIPATYEDLELVFVGGSTNATATNFAVTINGLTTAIYDQQRAYWSNSTGGSSSTDNTQGANSWASFAAPGSAGGASTGTAVRIRLFDYQNTTFGKEGEAFGRQQIDTVPGGAFLIQSAIQARTTAAITSITITIPAGAFTAGSTVKLFGIGVSQASGLNVPQTTPDLVYLWDVAANNLKASSGYTMMSMKNSCPWNSDFTFYPTTAGQGITVDAATLNGYPVVSSSGASTARYTVNLTSAYIAHNTTVFALVKMSAFTNAPALFSGNTNALEFRFDSTGHPQLLKSFVAAAGTSTTALATSTWTQCNATYNDSTGAYAFRVAKAAAGSGTNVQGITAPISSLLYNAASGGEDFSGSLAFLAIYNRVLTAGEITAIEGYITNTYGV